MSAGEDEAWDGRETLPGSIQDDPAALIPSG